jgi:hypothetical protein
MARVEFTEPSEYDLIFIEHYIFEELSNPQAAMRVTASSGGFKKPSVYKGFCKRENSLHDCWL